ncbi:MAG TPA: serine O-acetyltransferase, partial [Candidatus Merdenecus merdavium]|nr:serine O-acetyltransferase [Candidatus Merdenecus merdavium]
EVPPNSTVVGVPGRIVKQDNIKVPRSDMDQVDLPDPVLKDLEILRQCQGDVQKKLIELEEEIHRLKDISK